MSQRCVAYILLLIAGITAPARAVIYYVDANAPGPVHNGLSWNSAFTRFEDALMFAGFFDEIRVASGVYVPDPTGLSDPRDARFVLPDFTVIAGGYAGSQGANPDARDFTLYETILSGDLNRDDLPGANRGDNCRNVVFAFQTGLDTVFSGFTVRGGNSDAVFLPPFFPLGDPGGGMFVVGNLTIEDCRFVDNDAFEGGGVFSFEGSPVLRRCHFENNRAIRGGALGLFGTDDPIPPGNVAGGGSVAHGTPMLSDCSFVGNRASNIAGALWVDGVAENPTIENSYFEDNHAIGDGGALWTGGGFCNLKNCLMVRNTSQDEGGAIYADTQVTITHSTLVENSAESGGAVYAFFARPTFIDSIVWGNLAADAVGEQAQANGGVDTPIADFSCIDGWTGKWGGFGNTGDDPLFVPGPLGCYYLSQTTAGQPVDSPCIDTGSFDSFFIGFDTVTTSQDETLDTMLVDMGYHYVPSGMSYLPGDSDFDSDIDLSDYAAFQRCFDSSSGEEVLPCCRMFDLSSDQLIDLVDYSIFDGLIVGP